MILFKPCAAILSMILVLQTGCDFWCHETESDWVSLVESTAAPACHGTADKGDGSEQEPSRHHEPSKECLHPQATDDNSKLQTKIVKASHPAAVNEFSGIQLHVQPRTIAFSFSSKDFLNVSPPSSLILRI